MALRKMYVDLEMQGSQSVYFGSAGKRINSTGVSWDNSITINYTATGSTLLLDETAAMQFASGLTSNEFNILADQYEINFQNGVFQSTLDFNSAVTASRDWLLPNKSGTIALLSDIPTGLPTTSPLSVVLSNGNTTGANDISVDSGQKVTFGGVGKYIDDSSSSLKLISDTSIRAETTNSFLRIDNTTFEVTNNNTGNLKSFNVQYLADRVQYRNAVAGLSLSYALVTANRVQTLQDATGTIALLSDIPASLPTTSPLSVVLSNGNTTGANNIVVSTGQQIHFDTSAKNISESGISWNSQFNTIVNSNSRIKHTLTETVINDDGVDLDFRLEGLNDSSLLRSNAANDSIGIGTSGFTDTKLAVWYTGSLTGTRNAMFVNVQHNGTADNYGARIEAKGNTSSRNVAIQAAALFSTARNIAANLGTWGTYAGDFGHDVALQAYNANNAGTSATHTYAAKLSNVQTNSANKYGAWINLGGNQASGTGYGLDIDADSTFTSGTIYGARVGVGGTTPTKYGVYITVNAASTTNYGLYSNVSGATNNWGLYVNAGGSYLGGGLQLAGLTTTPVAGYVLQSTDANGNADWVDFSTLTAGLPTKYAADHVFVLGTPLTINHSLNSTDIQVQLKDSTGKLVIPDVVNNYLANSVDITVNVAGTYRVIIIG